MILPFSENAKKLVQNEPARIDEKILFSAKSFIEKVMARETKELIIKNEVEGAKLLAISKAILSLCPYHILAIFADNYSKLWGKFFVNNPAIADEFLKELFPSMQLDGNAKINIFEFLKAEESISLVSAFGGFVYLSREELSEVAVKQVKKRIMQLPLNSNLPREFQEVAVELTRQSPSPAPKSKALEKDDVKEIRAGVKEGQRYYACMKLSRACFRDDLSFDQAKQVIVNYVNACQQGKTPFTEKEALKCLEWVYRKGKRLS